MNYKDGVTLGKIYKKLQELRLKSYTDAQGVVQVQWQGNWKPYDYVMQFDKRMEII